MMHLKTHPTDYEQIYYHCYSFIHVYLIHHHHLDPIHFCHSFLYQVQDSTRRGDDHMH